MQLPPLIIFKDNLDSTTSMTIPSIVHMLSNIGYNTLCLEYTFYHKNALLDWLKNTTNEMQTTLINIITEQFKKKNIDILSNLSWPILQGLLRNMGFENHSANSIASNIIIFYAMQKIINKIMPLNIDVHGIDLPNQHAEMLNNIGNLNTRESYMLMRFKELINLGENCVLIFGKIHISNFIQSLQNQGLLNKCLLFNLSSNNTVYEGSIENLAVKKIFIIENNPIEAIREIAININARLCTMLPEKINWLYDNSRKISLPITNYALLENIRRIYKPS